MSNLLPIYFLINLKFATVSYFKIGSKHPWEKKKKNEERLYSNFNMESVYIWKLNCFHHLIPIYIIF